MDFVFIIMIFVVALLLTFLYTIYYGRLLKASVDIYERIGDVLLKLAE